MGFFSESKTMLLPGASTTSSTSTSFSKRRRERKTFLSRPLLLLLFAAGSFWSGRVFEKRQGASSLSSSSSLSTNAIVVPTTASGSETLHSIRVQTLSLKPRVFFLPGFADAALAEALAAATEPKLSPSTLALRPGERAEDKVGIRTSSGTFVSSSEDPTGFLAAVERKLEALTGLPRSHGEPFNVLRYDVGGRYETHYDSFNEKEYGKQDAQRVATLLVYLRVPPRDGGGQTCFPLAEAEGEELERGVRDYRSCYGLKVPPTRPGDAVLFYNLHPNSTIDKRSMHGGCELLSGSKWVATKWVRDRPFA